LILIGAALGIPATWMLLIGVMAVVTMSALYVAWIYCQHLDLFDVDSWWRAAPTTVVLLCLVGLPLTIGFPARVALYHAILDTQRWLVLPIAIAAEALFVSAMLRLLLDLESVPDPGLAPAIKGTAKEKGRPWRSILAWVRRVDWPRELRYGAGAALALGTLILGVAPGLLSAPGLGTWFALPTLPMWAALLLPVVGAIVLYRAQDSVLDVIGAWWPVAESVLSAEPLYRAVEGTFAYIGAAIWGSSQVVEGAGYMAWVALACLVIYLFIISR
jgi:hypothetical protein